MCFSFEVSLATGIFSWSVGLYLLNKKLTKTQRQNVIYLLIFSSMQFLDAILWYIKMEKNNTNYIITSFCIPTILVIQGLFNIYYVNNLNILWINIITIICIIYIYYRFNGYSDSMCDNNLSSPVWGSTELQLWEVLLFAIYMCYPNILYIIFILATKFIINGAFGSMWCALGNLITFKYLLTY